jgi:acetoin utilization deacetylase AcuC-like enzyme
VERIMPIQLMVSFCLLNDRFHGFIGIEKNFEGNTIIDLDVHQGNGTEIFKIIQTYFTFSTWKTTIRLKGNL